jgi:hypothetical protein
VNKQRAKMPPSQRAKQFAPFDAVVGLRKALYEKERLREPRKTLSEEMVEEINNTLKILKPHDTVTVIHYKNTDQKYIKTTGEVLKIDPQTHSLTIELQEIFFENIYKIKI